ncbi:MAG: hypothetical protein OYG31_01520 [Candidatus Kaiserbacteria bacterium]|nr:hypothetical protein [Candidatus Kaiserbacteria bacterium]
MQCYTFSRVWPFLAEGIAIDHHPDTEAYGGNVCLLGQNGGNGKLVTVRTDGIVPDESGRVHYARFSNTQGFSDDRYLLGSEKISEEVENDCVLLRVNVEPSGFWSVLSGSPKLLVYGYGSDHGIQHATKKLWFDGLVEMASGDSVLLTFLGDADECVATFVVALDAQQEGLTCTIGDTHHRTESRSMFSLR